jgi:hypothetical protein
LDLTEATAALDAAEARGDFGDAFTRILGRTRPSTLSAAIQRRERDEAARQAEADRRAKAERKAARAAAQAQAEATGAE